MGDSATASMTTEALPKVVPADSKGRLLCQFYLVKKKRQCGMTRRAGSQFCSEHSNDHERVPCPLDPSHTVRKDRLEAHLQKCTKIRHDIAHQAKQRDIPWYKQNMNALGDGVPDPKAQDTVLLRSVPIIEWIYEHEFDGGRTGELPLIQKHSDLLERTERFQTLKNDKHAIQQSSLIQHLKDADLWPDSETRTKYIELGCGRAEFSRYVNLATHTDCANADADANAPSFLLVDRASQRLRFDNRFSLDVGQPVEIRRERIDIKDLNLDALLPDAAETPTLVCISKHLCGVATDLSLRCLLNSAQCNDHLAGILIAMCCRHVCQSSEYVNKDYISGLLTRYHAATHAATPAAAPLAYPDFFRCLKKFCSYCTCGLAPNLHADRGADEHFTGLTHDERKRVGHMARRIVDEGRARFMQAQGYDTLLFRYVDSAVTLEDTALLALKRRSPATVT